MREIKNMTVKKIEVERFSITSSKPFEAVVVALEAAVGKPDMLEFRKTTASARDFGELERTVQAQRAGKQPPRQIPGKAGCHTHASQRLPRHAAVRASSRAVNSIASSLIQLL